MSWLLQTANREALKNMQIPLWSLFWCWSFRKGLIMSLCHRKGFGLKTIQSSTGLPKSESCVKFPLWNSVFCHLGHPGFPVAISAAWEPSGRMVWASLSTNSHPPGTPQKSLGYQGFWSKRFYFFWAWQEVFCPYPILHVKSYKKFWLTVSFPNKIKIITEN